VNTNAIVNNPMAASNTLWHQRAVKLSMFSLLENQWRCSSVQDCKFKVRIMANKDCDSLALPASRTTTP
jgi:hypothetical protein